MGRWGSFGRRRLTAVAALLLLAGGLPARAGVEIAGTRVGADLPFVSSNVDVLGHLPAPGAVSAQFQGAVMYVSANSGLSTYDVSDPARPVPLGFLPLPSAMNEDVSIAGDTLLLSTDYGAFSTTVVDISNPRLPMVRNTYLPRHDSHTASCVAPDCRYAFLAGGGSGLGVLDTVTGAEIGPVATEVGRTHDVQFDSDGYAWVVGGRGTAAYDVTDPTRPVLVAMTDDSGRTGPLNDFIHHNSWRPDGPDGEPGDIVLVTEEDWLKPRCDGAGLFQTWRISGPLSATSPATLTNLDSWDTREGALPDAEEKRLTALCSAHFFDHRDGFVAIGWYEQGHRILDVRDPQDIRQVGYFVPPVNGGLANMSAYWAPTDPTGSIIYALDHARGVDVIRFHRDAPPDGVLELPDLEARTAAVPTVAQPHPVFGWGCRLPVA